MALTFTPDKLYPNDVWGSVEVRKVTATPAANDYPSGGYTVAPGAGISLSQIYAIVIQSSPPGYNAVVNSSTGKIQLFQSTNSVGPQGELPANTNVTAPLVLLLLGK